MSAYITSTYKLLIETASRLAVRSPIDYLEIGVRDGDSLKSVLETGRVSIAVGIDTWNSGYEKEGQGNANHVVENLAWHLDKMTLITGNSHVILPGLFHLFDLIFVDGDHTRIGAWQDLEDCRHLLAAGGVILFDDTAHPAHPYLHAVAEEWAKTRCFQIKFHDTDHGTAELWK